MADQILQNFPYMDQNPPSPLTRWYDLDGNEMISTIDEYNEAVDNGQVGPTPTIQAPYMQLSDVYPGIEKVAAIPEPADNPPPVPDSWQR